MEGRPDRQRRKQLRDEWKATQANAVKRRWYANTASFATFLPLVCLLGFAFGVLSGGFQLVHKGLVPRLWQRGQVADLVWIGAGALVGAGLVLLWGRLRRQQVVVKFGVWAGAIAGAGVVAPANVAIEVLPPAVIYGLLFIVGCGALLAGLVWSDWVAFTAARLAGGATAGAVVGASVWLGIRALDPRPGVPPDGLQQAFYTALSQLAGDLTGIGTLISATVLGMLGAILLRQQGSGR